jgi:hypothetical protein
VSVPRQAGAQHSQSPTKAENGLGDDRQHGCDGKVPAIVALHNLQLNPAQTFGNENSLNPEGPEMSRHNEMPPVPPANRSHKGTGDATEVSKDISKTKGEVNTAEQSDTANIKQNTTNAGFFKGRRVK